MVSIIIVNHNTGRILQECIKSIYVHEKSTDFEVIVVDNNSTDDSKRIIEILSIEKNNFKNFYLTDNLGFSTANNRGISLSSGEYILIMNPDIIFTESILSRLINSLANNTNIGAICPLLIGNDGNFQRNYFQRYPTIRQFIYFYSFMANTFSNFPKLINRYLKNQDINPNSKRIEFVEQIPCAFFLTTRNIFEQVGKMDENYILFFEDVDLSFQIGKKYKLAIDTSLRVTHLGGVSFGNENNWWMYGRFIMSMNHFFDKNYNWMQAFILKVLTIKNSLFIILVEQIKKIFRAEDEYRLKKHKFFLKEFKERYL